MITFPRIHLAVDNCFASKRWTTPEEWVREIATLGVTCIEASADTEIDPLYHGKDYVKRWTNDVRLATDRYGATIANLYSGHGTYATLGLAHTDHDIRRRFLADWLYPMLETAQTLGAGLGFFCHAFPQTVLSDPALFNSEFGALATNLAEVARYNQDLGSNACVGVEQMYSPHQVPWRISQAKELLRSVYAQSADPFYVTIDVGHQSGQHRYRRPGIEELISAASSLQEHDQRTDLWIGPDEHWDQLREISKLPESERQYAVEALNDRLDAFPYIFSETRDGDPYEWLRELGGWSPIVHLQQTEGTTSAHWPFNDETNRTGIINGPAVLTAIHDHNLAAHEEPDLPPRVNDVYLTIEVFASPAENPQQIRKKIRDSVEYWRKYVPEDGETVDVLVSRLVE